MNAVGPEPDRRGAPAMATAALLAGLALVVAGAFLPWVWSGSSSRSSFALVRSADRLGIVDDGFGLVILRGWYLVPLLAAIAVVLVTIGRPRAAAVAGLLLAAVVATVATIVLVAAPSTGPGPVASLVGAAVAVAASVVVLRGGRPRSRPPTAGSA